MMGRGGSRGGLRVTKHEMVNKILKKINDSVWELNKTLSLRDHDEYNTTDLDKTEK